MKPMLTGRYWVRDMATTINTNPKPVRMEYEDSNIRALALAVLYSAAQEALKGLEESKKRIDRYENDPEWKLAYVNTDVFGTTYKKYVHKVSRERYTIVMVDDNDAVQFFNRKKDYDYWATLAGINSSGPDFLKRFAKTHPDYYSDNIDTII